MKVSSLMTAISIVVVTASVPASAIIWTDKVQEDSVLDYSTVNSVGGINTWSFSTQDVEMVGVEIAASDYSPYRILSGVDSYATEERGAIGVPWFEESNLNTLLVDRKISKQGGTRSSTYLATSFFPLSPLSVTG